jgi:hypothetical protein
MCIYCGTTHYRAIYESHSGPIPIEENGRKYHIHHIDGNHSNNDPSNLTAVTIKEHYDIHYSQGDWLACHRLAAILKYTPEEISELAKKNVKEQIENGKHPWQGGEHQRKLAKKLIENGTHHWLTEGHSEFIRERELEKVRNGTHNMSGSSMNKWLLEQGKHSSQNPEFRSHISKLQKEYNLKRVEEGNHPFQQLNSFVWVCEHCGKSGKNKANYERHINSKTCEIARKKNNFT